MRTRAPLAISQASTMSRSSVAVTRAGSALPRPRPPPPPNPPRRPPLGLDGSYWARTWSSGVRRATGSKFMGMTAALPSITTLPRILSLLASSQAVNSARVGCWNCGPPRPPPRPPRPPRPPAASAVSLAGTGGPWGSTSCTAEPLTVPLVEGVQASTSNFRLAFTGETMKPEARSLSQPGWPNSQGSTCAFWKPQSVICLATQRAAPSRLGVPVMRGP